jgi:hypothetical protein
LESINLNSQNINLITNRNDQSQMSLQWGLDQTHIWSEREREIWREEELFMQWKICSFKKSSMKRTVIFLCSVSCSFPLLLFFWIKHNCVEVVRDSVWICFKCAHSFHSNAVLYCTLHWMCVRARLLCSKLLQSNQSSSSKRIAKVNKNKYRDDDDEEGEIQYRLLFKYIFSNA